MLKHRRFFIGFKIFLSKSLQSNETYSTVRVGKCFSDKFPINSGLKQGDDSSPLLLNFASYFAIRRIQINLEGLKLNGTHQRLYYVDGVSISG